MKKTKCKEHIPINTERDMFCLDCKCTLMKDIPELDEDRVYRITFPFAVVICAISMFSAFLIAKLYGTGVAEIIGSVNAGLLAGIFISCVVYEFAVYLIKKYDEKQASWIKVKQ